MTTPSKDAKRAEGKAVKLDKAVASQLDRSKLAKGKKEESAEVSAQWNGWVKNPYDEEWYHFSNLHPGNNILEAGGDVWIQWIFD